MSLIEIITCSKKRIEVDTSDEAFEKYSKEWLGDKEVKTGDVLKLRNTTCRKFRVIGVGFGTGIPPNDKVVWGHIDNQICCSYFGQDLSKFIEIEL